MTHLRIELNNILENVSSAVILKLYELASSGDLDASSHLAGNLYVPATYLEYIDVLTDLTNPKFRDLTIIAGNIYIMFADPEVLRVLLANNIGDGVGITTALAALVTYSQIGSIFRANTTITLFDELRYFTSLTQCPSFNGCENLLHILLPSSVTNLGRDSISNCTSLVSLGDTSNLTTFNPDLSYYYRALVLDFDNLDSLTGYFRCNYGAVTPNSDVTLSSPGVTGASLNGLKAKTLTITSPITSLSCTDCPNLLLVTLPLTCRLLDGKGFKGCSNLTSVNLSVVLDFSLESLMNTGITNVDFSSATHIGSSICNSLSNIILTLPQNIWTKGNIYTSLAFGNCTFATITNPEVVSNYDYFTKEFPGMNQNSTIIDVMPFIKATSVINDGLPQSRVDGLWSNNENKYVRQIYLPKLTTSLDFLFGEYPATILNNSPSRRFRVKLLYLKDITAFTHNTFYGITCDALVINNTTPPAAPVVYYDHYNVYSNNHIYGANLDTWGNISDALDPNQAFSFTAMNNNVLALYNQNKIEGDVQITAIYVPDSAVNTYKAASGWTPVASIIKPISELNSGVIYANKTDWETAGKPVGLIADYLGLTSGELSSFVSANSLSYYSS